MDLKEDIEIGIDPRTAKTGAARVKAALEGIRRKSRQTAKDSARDSKKMAKGFRTVAAAAAIVTASILVLRGVIKTQIAFGQAISDLSAITGAVGKDLDFLRQKSKEFGETTTLSATQAAEAFKIIASAKPDLLENVDALALVTQEAIALAEATGESLPTAANAMAASLNQFGAGAEEASRFINVLAAGSKRGAALVGEVSESLKSAGVIAAQAGLSFEETNAALQVMSTFAIKGGEAGTQLRQVLLSLTTKADDEFNPSIVGINTALDNLAVAALKPAEKLKLFGARNVAVAGILIENRDALEKLTGQLTGTSIAYEQQAIRVDNLAGDLKTLKSAYEGVQLTIGAQLNGTLRNLTQIATENVRALSANPLLSASFKKILDINHRILQDISIAFDQIKESVGAAFQTEITNTLGVMDQAIQNIIKSAEFLWEQFVILGPVNLKLGFTLMIAAADRFRIALVQTVRTAFFLIIQQADIFAINFVAAIRIATLAVVLSFKTMGQDIARVFDNIKINIGTAIDAIINVVRDKIAGVADTLDALNFEGRAEEIRNIANAIGSLAGFEESAREQSKLNEQQRRAEIQVIDDLIRDIEEKAEVDKRLSREVTDDLISNTEETANVQRVASAEAVALAIAERDAQAEIILALRTKRKEIEDGSAAVPPPTGGSLSTPAEEAADAYGELGDKAKVVVDGLSDGISDMVVQGKANFKDLAASIIQDLIRIAVKAQLLNLFTSIFGGGFGGFGGGAGALAPGATGALPGGGAALIPAPSLNAAHGLDFKVGGQGGTDSQLIAFNATPGEAVSVKTPSQQRSGGGGVTVKQTNIIDARGADAERIEAILPALLEQNRQQVLSDVIRMRDKGSLRR